MLRLVLRVDWPGPFTAQLDVGIQDYDTFIIGAATIKKVVEVPHRELIDIDTFNHWLANDAAPVRMDKAGDVRMQTLHADLKIDLPTHEKLAKISPFIWA